MICVLGPSTHGKFAWQVRNFVGRLKPVLTAPSTKNEERHSSLILRLGFVPRVALLTAPEHEEYRTKNEVRHFGDKKRRK